MRYQLSKRPLRARDHTPTVIWAQRGYQLSAPSSPFQYEKSRSQVRQLCGMQSSKARRRRSVSASFVGFTGSERSAILACAGVRPPFFWLHGTQAMTTLSQLSRSPGERLMLE